jgi:hypothetical protein
MLAFDLAARRTKGLAGFAIRRKPPQGPAVMLPNRLRFASGPTADTRGEDLAWTPSDQAPFQKFRWVDHPGPAQAGAYTYDVTALYFDGGGRLRAGPSAQASVELVPRKGERFELGFTAGYLSSQAYADQFHNGPFRPAQKTIDYETAPFAKQYDWLGGHARRMVFAFLQECVADPAVTVDLFAYDLDEPDFVRGLQKLGGRLRAFLDDAPLHTKPGALEIQAKALLLKSAGTSNVKTGHFHRFAHDKVLVQRRQGKPVKVLTGSANFSVRGLYVQANSVWVFDDETVAGLYGAAFDQSFADEAKFATSEVAEGWHEVKGPGLPRSLAAAFSPHTQATVSLARVADAIQKAKSSVLFAVMELAGGGPVLDDLRALATRKAVFSYGMTQTLTGVKVYKPGQAMGLLVPFAYLHGMVPAPFHEETSGGMGMVIHHKFVVVDFNGAAPQVFAGSSNLAAGGEEANGDNLLAISDPEVAAAYAVEAVRLVDHYHFRAVLQDAKAGAPLTLQGPGAKPAWWAPYYDPKDIRSRERDVFSRAPG